jgi:hypothetical protein
LGATFAFDYIGFGEAYEVLGSNLLGCKQFLGSRPPAKPEYYPIHVEGAHYTGPALEGFLIIKKKKKKKKKKKIVNRFPVSSLARSLFAPTFSLSYLFTFFGFGANKRPSIDSCKGARNN